MIFLMAYAPEVPKPAGRDMGTSAALNLALSCPASAILFAPTGDVVWRDRRWTAVPALSYPASCASNGQARLNDKA
jgi:hypothetical protein